MKKYAYLSYLLLLAAFAFGQKKDLASSIKKPKYKSVRKVIAVPNKGILVASHAPENNISKIDIHIYDHDGKLVWKVKPACHQLKYDYQALVASEYSDYTYLYQSDWTLKSTSKLGINISRINQLGELTLIFL